MTIAKKLYLLIIAVITGLVLLTGMGIYQIERVNTAASFSTVNTVPNILALDDASEAAFTIRVALWKFISDTDPAVRNSAIKSMNAAHERVLQALDQYEKQVLTDATDRAMLQADRDSFAAYEAARAKVMALATSGSPVDARNTMLADQTVVDNMMKALFDHKKYNEKLGQQGASTAVETKSSANILAVIVSLIVAGVVGITGLLLARRISSALNEAVSAAEAVATGDLTRQIRVTSKDEIGQLMQALSNMTVSLVKIVGDVRHSVSTIARASNEIASGNLDLSSRTEQQAGSLEETASAMEQLTSTVKQNAENARQANQLAASASAIASEGGDVVHQVVTTMDAINTSSRKIVDIISVIDGIAFQTNILALNAAVEAARAGEQGRGFAVVASEVRNLAQRSAAAAKEIKQLIDDSVTKVTDGSKLVEQAGSTMEQVVSSVRRVTDVVIEISAASSEQSDGIGQVNIAITQMDEATQQNAALVEEAAAAAQSLQDQAQRLEQTVKIFKLDGRQAIANNPSAAFFNANTAKAIATPEASIKGPQKSDSKNKQSMDDGEARPRLALEGSTNGAWEQF